MDITSEPVQFDDFVHHAPAIFENIDKEGKSILVEREGKLYTVTPAGTKSREKRRNRVFTHDDSLWNIVGMAKGGEPYTTSENIHQAIADAYESHQS